MAFVQRLHAFTSVHVPKLYSILRGPGTVSDELHRSNLRGKQQRKVGMTGARSSRTPGQCMNVFVMLRKIPHAVILVQRPDLQRDQSPVVDLTRAYFGGTIF